MKAIVMRDFRAYRTFFILLVIVMLLYSYLNIRFGSVDGIVGFLVIFIPSIAGVVLFLGDGELLAHMMALPISRRELVVGKYLSTYLFGVSMYIITISIIWLLSSHYINARADFEMLISVKGLIFAFIPMTLIVSCTYPFLFKYGIGVVSIAISWFIMVFYGIGTVFGEDYLKRVLGYERHGIFVAIMALFTQGEKNFGKFLFYGSILAFLSVLVIGSVSLSVYWIERKDFK